jgi:hypothetical protein
MSVEGNWKITIKSPVGPQVSTVVLRNSGGVLSGTQSGQGVTSEISDGKVDGNTVYWINHVTTPMKMKLEFTGTVDGDQITGKVKAGMMGSFSFAGSRES